MLKIVTIIGARPQIIKAAALSRAVKDHFSDRIREVIVHTGQHYDEKMSGVFFHELGLPAPAYNLQAGSNTHGKQTAEMISGIEEVLIKEKPGAIVLYGDTNSTLAGAVAASKVQVPIVHIEAGLRSFNKAMPEEVNRILCDHVSTLLFSPTQAGYSNLVKEGFRTDNKAPYHINNPKICHCGDVMLDNSLYFSGIADKNIDLEKKYGVKAGNYLLATIHRDTNTDDPQRLTSLFAALNEISLTHKTRVVLPLHPRTARLLQKNIAPEIYNAIQDNADFKITEPASFIEMIALEKNAMMVATDSGGVQKEAFYFKKPCIILRPETEWVELVACGAAIIADADKQKIVDAFRHFRSEPPQEYPSFYGDGKAAEFICKEMITYLG